MPIVGTGTAAVMARATFSIVPSMTIEKAPASAIAAASAATRSRLVLAAALHLEPAGGVDRLRHQPDMPHDRHPAPGQKAHRLGHLRAAFELDRGAAGLCHEMGGAAERLFGRFLVAAERQVDDDQCARSMPRITAAPCAIIISRVTGRVLSKP